MFTNSKDFLIALTIVCLCCMIKCKFDENKGNSSHTTDTKTISNILNDSSSIQKNTTETLSISDIQSAFEAVNIDSSSVTNIDSLLDKKIDGSKTVIDQKVNQTVKKKTRKAKKTFAKIKFDEIMWDFGEITEGDIIKKKFKFTNTGKAPLQIIGADASCGCARPTVPFLDIAPGESSEIGITYNSVNKEGDQTPEIIIESNTFPRYNVIKLKGTVKAKAKQTEDSLKTKQDTLLEKK